MGRKNLLKSFKMFNQADISANQVTKSTNIQNLDKASIYLIWDGDPTGTITVQARNGEKSPFYDLDFGNPITMAGAPGNHQLVFNELPFTDIQITYTATSGSGLLDATLTAKVVGA